MLTLSFVFGMIYLMIETVIQREELEVDKSICKPFVFRISDEQKELLREIANRTDRSMSATIRRAVDEYIERRERVFDKGRAV